MKTLSKLEPRRSGYIGSSNLMADFLNCWRREVDLKAPSDIQAEESIEASVSPVAPQSLRDFSQARRATRFRSAYEIEHPGQTRFVDLSELQPFRIVSPFDYGTWKVTWGSIAIPDNEYYRYDKTQRSDFRGRDLESMLVVGGELGGAFYLLLPNERTADGEAEVLLLHHGGLIVRFKSFAHLLVHLYLEERERAAGRDASLGHLYYFPGRLSDTCAQRIIEV